MSRWDDLKTYLSEWLVDLEDGEIKFDGYSQVKCILAKMKELDAMPVVEVEVPELVNNWCNPSCPIITTCNRCERSVYTREHPHSILSMDVSTPGPSCPRGKP